MPAILNLIGQTFGRLTVLSQAPFQGGRSQWHCVCECGAEKIVNSNLLRRGRTQSCGCLNQERRSTHGLSKEPEYMPWKAMVARCTNPNSTSWPLYGGRGITVHPSLMTPQGLIAEIGRRPSPRHTIERIDNEGHYEPGNICWATQKEQNRNQRSNRLLTYQGRTQCLAAWAEEMGLTTQLVWQRLRAGWSVERALTQPIRMSLR
jgi:hypothetical protein